MGVHDHWFARADGSMSSVRAGPEGVPELRELRAADGASVQGPAGRSGRGQASGEFLRVFRFHSAGVEGERRGCPRGRGKREVEKVVRGLRGEKPQTSKTKSQRNLKHQA